MSAGIGCIPDIETSCNVHIGLVAVLLWCLTIIELCIILLDGLHIVRSEMNAGML